MVLIWGVITSLAIINRLAFSRNNRQIQPFGAYSEIRNVDMLIIGDMINPRIIAEDGKKYVQIKAPFRNLESCYELIRHTHSILNDENDESGKSAVIIAVKKKYLNHKGFSVFDVAFFHEITIKKYGLERLSRFKKLPVMFSPLASLIMAMNITSGRYKETECLSREIKEFCLERGYTVKFFVS